MSFIKLYFRPELMILAIIMKETEFNTMADTIIGKVNRAWNIGLGMCNINEDHPNTIPVLYARFYNCMQYSLAEKGRNGR